MAFANLLNPDCGCCGQPVCLCQAAAITLKLTIPAGMRYAVPPGTYPMNKTVPAWLSTFPSGLPNISGNLYYTPTSPGSVTYPISSGNPYTDTWYYAVRCGTQDPNSNFATYDPANTYLIQFVSSSNGGRITHIAAHWIDGAAANKCAPTVSFSLAVDANTGAALTGLLLQQTS